MDPFTGGADTKPAVQMWNGTVLISASCMAWSSAATSLTLDISPSFENQSIPMVGMSTMLNSSKIVLHVAERPASGLKNCFGFTGSVVIGSSRSLSASSPSSTTGILLHSGFQCNGRVKSFGSVVTIETW